MKNYEVGLVFFIESEDIDGKKGLLEKLEVIKGVTICDVYNDGEDWNIECLVLVKCNAKKNIDDKIHTILIKTLPDCAWDYHYIKGVDTDYYWQP